MQDLQLGPTSGSRPNRGRHSDAIADQVRSQIAADMACDGALLMLGSTRGSRAHPGRPATAIPLLISERGAERIGTDR